MKAIIIHEFGGIEKLIFSNIDIPTPTAGEVLIKVKAISINPVDVKTRAGRGVAGRIKEDKPIILGWDISGVVTKTNAPEFKVGDEVFGMVNFPGHGKAYAEYVVAPANQLALKPNEITHEAAAAATLTALTAYQALVHHANIKKGDRVLIHAAAGGVGHYAVQLANYLGAYVIATSSAQNKDFVLSLGANEHIDYKTQPFEKVVDNLDFVLDTIGGENIDRSLDIIKPGGTIISVPSGLNEEVTKKASERAVKGYFILVKSSGDDMKKLAALLSEKRLISHVSQTYLFHEMAKAHLSMETGRTKGKIVIQLNS
jgi:NADPH:quinone reductase-like Zn-dependent oxidoreductase